MPKLLLDENIGLDIQQELSSFETHSLKDMGWLGKKNGELMKLISLERFDIFITTDKNLPFQQNLSNLTYALWVLDSPSNKVSTLRLFVPLIIQEIELLNGQRPEMALKYITVEGFSTGKKKRMI